MFTRRQLRQPRRRRLRRHVTDRPDSVCQICHVSYIGTRVWTFILVFNLFINLSFGLHSGHIVDSLYLLRYHRINKTPSLLSVVLPENQP
ncbi:hypothetical protein PSPO01_15458 [Paraphaeosphaeria sporulosa]